MAAEVAGVSSQQRLPPSQLKPPLTERQKSFAKTCGAKIQAPHIVLHFSSALPPVLENDGGGSFGAYLRIDHCK